MTRKKIKRKTRRRNKNKRTKRIKNLRGGLKGVQSMLPSGSFQQGLSNEKLGVLSGGPGGLSEELGVLTKGLGGPGGLSQGLGGLKSLGGPGGLSQGLGGLKSLGGPGGLSQGLGSLKKLGGPGGLSQGLGSLKKLGGPGGFKLPRGLVGKLPNITKKLPKGLLNFLPKPLSTNSQTLSNVQTNPLLNGKNVQNVNKKSRFSIKSIKNGPKSATARLLDEGIKLVGTQTEKFKSKLSPLKAFPLYTFVTSSFAKIYENSTLFNKIRQTTTIEDGTYKTSIDKLDPMGKQNYNDACALIYRYYYKDIAINYSYLREAKHIDDIGKEKIYMEAQINLFNSCDEKDFLQFDKVFNTRDQFTKLIISLEDQTPDNNSENKPKLDKDNIGNMKIEIEKQFLIVDDTGPEDITINCSYLILDILHDIHNEIDQATEIEEAIKNDKQFVIDEKAKAKIEFMQDIKNIDQHNDIDIAIPITNRILDTAIGQLVTQSEEEEK
jgi:hypothetical protein